MRKIVDLTLLLSEDLPCAWPAHMPFKRTNWNWFKRVDSEAGCVLRNKYGAYHTGWMVIDEHTGTHFDAPSHYVPLPDSGLPHACESGRITGDKVDISKMLGAAVMVDISHLRDKGGMGTSPLFTKADMIAWEKENGGFSPGEIVVLYTGWADFYKPGAEGEQYFLKPYQKTGGGWPTLDAECVEYLYECGIKCIATDGASVGAAENGIPSHIAGLAHEMAYIESLCNVDQLPTRGATFIFLPLKIEGSSGGPGRAIAVLPEE
ncbi:cyclase family protein [Dysosmobacter sp.]|uniref:cyclase family protein n=1 Tax=Dysosmobacter sp. TaxID=2591382 RepID=UPI003AB52DD7